MSCISLRSLTFMLLIACIVWSSSIEKCTAKLVVNIRNRGSKSKPPRKPLTHSKAPPNSTLRPHQQRNLFDVRRFGAKGDGKTLDNKAFLDAWLAACKVARSTVLVPAPFRFLVGQVSFSGTNCQPNIVFQLDGTIIAPPPWGNDNSQWLEFTNLRGGVTVRGKGIIDGSGSGWWQDEEKPRPTALRFNESDNVKVMGITIRDSPKCHLKFNNCIKVEVTNIAALSPENSPNTDGIILQDSKNVIIHFSTLSCGDDCVSIKTGCSNVLIHNVTCGPGHGISIGSLGNDKTKAYVSDITVRDIFMRNTDNGARIKTWQGGSGSVRGVRFSNIQMSEVKIPIVIDQFYTNKGQKPVRNETAAVSVSRITFDFIRGTYTKRPVELNCSDSVPCTAVTLSNIHLTPVKREHRLDGPYCWKAFGKVTNTVPPIVGCLKSGKPLNNRSS